MAQAPAHAVIFDLDGVLIDSNEAHFEAFSRIGKRLGIPFTRGMLEQSFGMHNNQIFPLWLGPGLSADQITQLADEKESLYREIATGRICPQPGAVELVRSLHSLSVPLAVGSSGPRANVELAVDSLGVRQYFKVLVTGDDVLHGKPAPDIFLKAAERLNIEPQSCVVIEDAPQGIQAAIRARMKVIAVATSRPAPALRAAHRVFASVRDLSPDAIRRIVTLD